MNFIRPNGLGYYRFFRQLHNRHIFDWYLEIGCRTGRSISYVRGNSIAVDPYFQIESNVIGEKPQFMAFQCKSDDFFEKGYLEAAKIKLALSFLDGMHLFEYLLRDFINAERHSSRSGVILLHDCCPSTYEMTQRDFSQATGSSWTGDVWKLIPILKQYRPDLKIDVLDARPTGLVVVSDLKPRSQVLQKNYDEIVREWIDIDLESYGLEKYYSQFELSQAQGYIMRADHMWKAAALDDGTTSHEAPEFVSP